MHLRALKQAGLAKRIMFGSGLDLTEWAAGIGRAVGPILEAPFLSAETAPSTKGGLAQ
jgi:hypothetical protein